MILTGNVKDVSTKNANVAKKEKFPVAPDGRLVIRDEDDEDEKPKGLWN